MNMDGYLYVGTYNKPVLMGTGEIYRGNGKGISIFGMDFRTGETELIDVMENIPNPSFLAADGTGRFLYAVNELDMFEEKEGGAVTSFRIGMDGRLEIINQEPTLGRAPCWLCLNERHSLLATANYSSGSLSVFPLEADGRILPMAQLVRHGGTGMNPCRQEGPHMHSVIAMDDGQYMATADLGIDMVHVYELGDMDGLLKEAATYKGAAGRGPRVVLRHPSQPAVYVVNELESTVSLLRWKRCEKMLELIQHVSTLKPGLDPVPSLDNLAAGMVLSPDGRHLYVTNRGDVSVAVFQVGEQGELFLVHKISTGGRTPRSVCITPDGRWVMVGNQDSDFMMQYQRDQITGSLAECQRIFVPTPVAFCTVLSRKTD